MVTVEQLCAKDVISMDSGKNLGKVDDVGFMEDTGKVTRLIIFGRKKWWGLFGREEDLVIPWEDILSFGEDVVLVSTQPPDSFHKNEKMLFSH